MSRQFPKTALEEFIEGSANLSPEEAAVLKDESTQNAVDVHSELEQTRRLLDVSDSLEDLAVVATRIERATPTEIRLIENAADMAAAGTEISPHDFVPSVEAYLGKRIAVEGFVQTAKKILEVLLAHLVKIWEKIENFFKLAFVIPSMLKIIKDRNDYIKRLDEPKKNKTEVKFENRLNALYLGKSIPFVAPGPDGPVSMLNLNVLLKAVDDFKEASAYVFKPYLKFAALTGLAIVSTIEKFDNTKPVEEINRLIVTMRKTRPVAPPHSGPSRKVKAINGDVFEEFSGPELLGNSRLVLEMVQSTSSLEPLVMLSAAKKTKLTLVNDVAVAPDDSVEFMHMEIITKEEMTDVLKVCHELLSELSDFYVGENHKAMRTVRSDMEKASKLASKKLDEFTTDNGTVGSLPHSSLTEYYKELITLNVAFAGWMESPTIPMYRKTIAIVNALMHVVDTNMKAYTVKG